MAITETVQFKSGKSAEAILDEYFRQRGRQVKPTSFAEERVQKKGDRIINGKYIEYKSFDQSAYTGNVFFEIVSVDNPYTLGWVFTNTSDYVVAIIRPMKKILIFRNIDILLTVWDLYSNGRFKVRKTKNQNSYKSSGLVVPLQWVLKHMRPIILSIP